MNYLAVDTSGKNLTIIINNNDKIYKYYDDNCGVNHSVCLMPEIEKLALEANFDFKQADFFAVVTGAGSFTGIRIGVSTIKAMCFAFNKPCLSITSFDTLAYNEKGGRVLAVIDAKHNGFYVCGYDDNKVIYEPAYIMGDKLKEIVHGYKVVSSTVIKDIESTVVRVDDGLINAIKQKIDEVTSDLESIVPLYVRKSQAEENR